MPFIIKNLQKSHLEPLRMCDPQDVIALCKIAFDYLTNGPQEQIYEAIAKKYNITPQQVQQAVEALISILIEATKCNADINGVKKPLMLGTQLERTTNFFAAYVRRQK